MAAFHLNILSQNQLKTFKQISFMKKLGFYLAGGTSLAIQLGHRTSQDFDFYNPKHFSAPKLYEKIEERFGSSAKKISQQKDTLFCQINSVDFSFFWYQYQLIERLTICQGVPMASLKDIAAMKVVAVSHRPAKRDYIDIYYLMQKFNLKDMFSFAFEKFPNFNGYLSARALTYFEDLEDTNQRSIKVLDPDFSWPKAKKKIFQEVKKYQLAIIKKS